MKTVDNDLDALIHQLACVDLDESRKKMESESEPLLAKLTSLGTELWLDTGDLELARSIWKKELTALTTNNTLANQVVQSGVMDDVIRETVSKLQGVASDISQEELILEIGFVINCRIALRLVDAFRVKVSVELHPSISRNLEKTLEYARRYYKVCPEFFIVKIPLTPEGYLAVRQLRKENIPINYTLGFSARQNYLAARLSNPDYVNVFLGRLNQVVSENQLGSGDMVGEKVTRATQNELLKLRKSNSRVTTRLIGASIRSGGPMASLAGMDVMTVPPAALKDFLDFKAKPGGLSNDLNVEVESGIDFDTLWGAKCKALWEVHDSLIAFVDALEKAPGLDNMSGDELVAFCEAHQMNLFHRFTPSDLEQIREHGKIPKLSHWPETIGVDDLMTQAALQSFAQDQNALDERIQSFLK